MTLYTLLVWAFLNNTAMTDSERMAAQFHENLYIVEKSTAPVCVEYCKEVGND